MAKDKDPTSKSEAIPGGSKASDLPASVGGTKDTGGAHHAANPHGTNPESERHAPVTTDAAAKTSDALDAIPKAGERAREGARRDTVPSRAEHETGRAWGDEELSELSTAERLAEAGGAADETTVAAFIDAVREFVAAVKARNLVGAWRAGNRIIAVFADLMDSGAFSRLSMVRESVSRHAAVLKGADSLTAELDNCRNEIAALPSHGPRLAWHGGEPDPTSGSPMPKGRPAAAEAGEFLDPSALMILFELVSKIWSHFTRNRGRR